MKGRSYPATDVGNAERLRDQHGADLKYSQTHGWLVWDGCRWVRDQTDEVQRRAMQTVRSIPNKKWARSSQSHRRLTDMVLTAQALLPVRSEELDTNSWLLNVENGTIGLRTGKLREHRREDLITKLAPVRFSARAKCPRWLEFLKEIMDGDAELIGFLQRAVGYSLTGDGSERCLFVLHGGGNNGKSTFLDVVGEMLGDYAIQTPTATLMMKRGDAIPNDLARLRGARFVTATEAERSQRFAEALVKQLTGGSDKMSARFLYKEFFDFRPECKIWLAANHRPEIRGTDHAIWNRIRLIPFEVEIPEDRIDKELPQELRAELPGVLHWAVEGCLKWQQHGLAVPQKVKAATRAYREDMDVLGEFIKDRCALGPRQKVTAAELYASYREWCEENGEEPKSQRFLAQQLRERGCSGDRERIAGKHARIWRGIGLRDAGHNGTHLRDFSSPLRKVNKKEERQKRVPKRPGRHRKKARHRRS